MVASVAQPVMTTIPRRKTDLQISFRKLVLVVGFMKISSKSHEERMQTHDPFFKTLNAPEIEIPGWRELSCLAAGSAGIASLRECAIAQAVEPDSSVKAWKFGCRARRREGKRRKGAWERGLVIRGVGREVRGSAVPRMPDRGRSADKTTPTEQQQRTAPKFRVIQIGSSPCPVVSPPPLFLRGFLDGGRTRDPSVEGPVPASEAGGEPSRESRAEGRELESEEAEGLAFSFALGAGLGVSSTESAWVSNSAWKMASSGV